MNLRFKNFPQLLVPFAASHFASARTIWLNDQHREHHVTSAATDKELFARKFSYLVPGGVTFNNLAFNDRDTAILHAERYGGYGIGDNGGGARCGNIGELQVKGVGKNILAGCANLHHSYGGFKAVYAIHEAIYSRILSGLLPVGVAAAHGVILTGSDAAYVSGTERGWGGLLVREQIFRPANFWRAMFFSPPPEVARHFLSDTGRARGANRQLLREAGNVSEVVHMFCNFLANAADQFAFARLAGIMHGAVTPSNQCIDGRWIDLTNTSFVSSSENCAGGNRESPSFHEEINEPINIGTGLVEQFAKYNCLQMSAQPFADYYRECLSQRLTVHLEYVCGLPRGSFTPRLSHPYLPLLLKDVLGVTANAPVIYDRWPTDPPKQEPLFEFMANLFIAASSGRIIKVECSNQESHQAPNLGKSFRRLLLDSKPSNPQFDPEPHLFLVGCAISAAKRMLLTPFFYKGRLEKLVCPMLANDQLDRLEGFIGAVVDASKWILNISIDRHVTVVELPNLAVSFDLMLGVFSVRVDSGEAKMFANPRALLEWCEDRDTQLFIEDEFDFLPYIRRLLGLVEIMNTASSHA